MKRKIMFIIAFLFSVFTLNMNVFAADIEVDSVDIVSDNGSTGATGYSGNDTVYLNTSLRYVGHYSQYKITFRNNSSNNYKVIALNNTDGQVSYEYQVDDNVILPSSTIEVLVKVTYNTLYNNTVILSSGSYLQLNHTETIRFEKVNNPNTDSDPTPEPNPNDETKFLSQSLFVGEVKSLSDIDLDIDNFESIDFNIGDKDVIIIEDGNIKAVGIGETDIEFDYDGNHYTIHILVTNEKNVDEVSEKDDIKNPNTHDVFLIIVILFGVSAIIVVSFKYVKFGKYLSLLLIISAILFRFVPDIVMAEDDIIEYSINFNVKILPQRYHVNRVETTSTQYSCSTCGSNHYYGNTGTMTVREARAAYIYTGQSDTTNSVFTAYFVSVNGTKTRVSESEVLKNESEGYYQFTYNRTTCLAGESLVIVYDKNKKKRNKKKLQDIDEDDLILCWDFDKGEFTYANPLWIKKPEAVDYYYLLKFENGYSLKVIGDHKLFCVNKNKFMNAGDRNEFQVGDSIYTATGEVVKLVSHERVFETIDSYSVITDYHVNMFANDILTSCVFSNIYDIKDMKYVSNDKKKIDVSKLDVDDKYIKGIRLDEVSTDFRGTEEETIRYINEYFEMIEKEKR